MKVMIANNSGREARRLASAYPGRVGHIYSPGGWRGPFAEFPYVLDNGAFSAWRDNKPFDVEAFAELCKRAANAAIAPLWLAVPDVVMNADATLGSWYEWAPQLRGHGWPLAFVVQDGHQPHDVPKEASVVFVGGSTDWKRETAAMWCRHFPRVHIGRVNTERWLWHFARAGAESCDGSGWFRGDRTQLDGLWYYLADSSDSIDDAAHGPMQPRFAFAGGAA